jgi:hypothetical protein
MNKYILTNINNNNLKIISKDEVLDKLYFLEYRIPTIEDVELNKNEKITILIKKHKNFNLFRKNTIENISKNQEKIPLYDVQSENIYLIGKYNVYNRVMRNFYRFPELDLINEIKDQIINLTKKIEEKKIKDPLILRKLRKNNLIVTFMENFNLEILYNTYLKVFYEYSEFGGKEYTICKKKSFLPQFKHIKPFYTKTEIFNMSLNLGITTFDANKKELTNIELKNLCKNVKTNEISANILLKHQQHIINYNYVGFIQYYTLQGSFFINQYMRNLVNYTEQNVYLEEMIEPMWNLVLDAPSFDKSYVLYRFVHNDNYLRDLEIGDIYKEKGFMSTTRDPFYRADLYQFGFILIKIRVPENIKGIALSLELLSNFPEEQEIIFPPNTEFRLIKKDEDVPYYHTDLIISAKIKTRYEFEWISNSKPKFEKRKDFNINKNNNLIDFLRIEKLDIINFNKKINYFIKKYSNIMNQFFVEIGNIIYTCFVEEYDSTTSYADFYAFNVKNGLSIYSIYKGYVLFFIEIAEEKSEIKMAVNFHLEYSALDTEKILGDNNFIKFISSISYFFDIPYVKIYANYLSCDNLKTKMKIIQNRENIIKQRNFNSLIQKEIKTLSDSEEQLSKNIDDINNLTFYGGSYCVDIYNYLTKNIKRYENSDILNIELKPNFSYYDLDMLKDISAEKILQKNDSDECYQLYYKVFLQNKKNKSIISFFLWLKDNKCYLLKDYIIKISRLTEINNPFLNDEYLLDSIVYLYNRKLIKSYNNIINKIDISSYKKRISDRKNEYRL